MASKQKEQRYEIHSQAEENPKMKELFDMLLQAGYFRIRIPSFQTFDKILGSLTWCIACSNFDIDIEYDDEMNLGQKIALSEKICNALKVMDCPYDLQPFQIRGLDFDKLYPVVNWLIKFVYETREQRWDFNTSMSNFLGKKTYPSFIERQKNEENTISETTKMIQTIDKRQTKNVNVKNLSLNDPIRIYSTLIEYGDITAYKTYNKLSGVVSGKIDLENELQKQKKNKSTKVREASEPGKKKKKGEEFDVTSFLFYDGAGSRAQKTEVESSKINALIGQQAQFLTGGKAGQAMTADKTQMKQFEAIVKKGSLAQMNAQLLNLPQNHLEQATLIKGQESGTSELSKAQSMKGDQYSTTSTSATTTTSSSTGNNGAIAEVDAEVELELDEQEGKNFTRMQRRASVVGANLMELLAQNQEEIKETLTNPVEDEESPELEFANIIKNEKEFHLNQVVAYEKKIAALQKKMEDVSDELFQIQEKEEQAEQYFKQHTELDSELKSTKQVIEKKLQQSKIKSKELIVEAEQMVERRNTQKEKRIKLKKEIKTQMQDNEQQLERVKKETVVLEEQELGEEFTEEYNKKKKKYDKKFEEFSQLNQDIAVLQRKVENYPSASEIAQYQLRLLELYESISSESEKEKDNYIRYNNYCDIKSQLLSFVDIMKTFKENYQVHKKSKSGRTKFIGDLTEAYKDLELNCQQAIDLQNKQKQQKERKLEEFNQLKNLERDYFKLLKDLRLELEVNDTLYQRQ